MHTSRKFWFVLVGAISIMVIIACSCNTLLQSPTATPPPPQPFPTEELPTMTPVPPTPSVEIAGKIAFSSDRSGKDAIYVMNADGSHQTQLTDNQADDKCPAWSPDGQKIAFSSDRDGNWQIYVMNTDGSHQTRLTNNKADDDADNLGNCDGLTWSPNGQKIAFVSDRDDNKPNNGNNGGRDIYVMNIDGSNQTRLTDPMEDDINPAWSPDGQKIVFASYRDSKNQLALADIYVMNADGSGQKRLTKNELQPENVNPAWSPDGQKIAFISRNAGGEDIYVINADGSDQIQLTNNNSDDASPAWSADGQKIAFSAECNCGEKFAIDSIYVMNTGGNDQTRMTMANESMMHGDENPVWSR